MATKIIAITRKAYGDNNAISTFCLGEGGVTAILYCPQGFNRKTPNCKGEFPSYAVKYDDEMTKVIPEREVVEMDIAEVKKDKYSLEITPEVNNG